jgi:hypothetical protein
MKNRIKFSSILLRGSLLAGLLCFAASPAYSAGTQTWTSAYATLQPNATGDAFVYTVSWAATDTWFGVTPGSTARIVDSPYGNNTTELDDVSFNGYGGAYLFDNTANGGSATTEIQYFNDGVETNASTQVLWEDPQNYTLGHVAPTTSNAKWDDLGDFTDFGDLTYGSGIQGVTGTFTANPNGSGPTSPAGIYTDEDGGVGGVLDDLGILLSGVTTLTTPTKGYLQVVVPYPTQVETATVGAGVLQTETLTLSGNAAAAVAQKETATITGTILAGVLQKETLTLSGNVSASGGGILNIIVTAVGMTNSPVTVPVAVGNSATTTTQSGLVKTALIANADVNAFFTVTNSGATVILAAKNVAANDLTMNVQSSPVSTTGPVAVATSANTTPGVAGGNGDALITVTGDLIAGSPLAVNVAVANGASATTVALNVKNALAALPAITANYTVTNSTTTVILTKTSPFTPNDATLNIASENGTCVGLTAKPTSTNTTLGSNGGGILNIIVTADGMTNSPKTIPVTIVASNSTSVQATAVRAALNADPDVSSFFTVTAATNAVITLTAKLPAADDATMNVESSPVSTTGPVAVPTSVNTTAGFAIGAGDVAVTVTGADIVGSPLAVNVALLATDPSDQAAAKIIAALSALPAITDFYTVGGSGARVTLTRNVAPLNVWEPTLNIAIANGTTTGVTETPTSVGADGFTDRFFPGTYTDNGAIELVVSTNASYVPKLAVSGDFDSDLDVDAADLVVAATGYASAGGTGKWYRDGDTNSDGDSDNADLGFVIGAFTPSVSSGSSTLTYDPATGNAKLDATTAGGAKITSFQIASAAATIVPGSYIGPAFGGTYQNVTTTVIGNTDTTLAGATGQVDLGNVFPTGMDLAGLQAYLTTAVYTGSSGTGQQQFNLVVASGGPTYATWSSGAAANVDTNGDGVDNGAAWALGAADPTANAIGLLPTLDNTTDPDFFIFTYNRSDDANADTNTTIAVQYGSDLIPSGWTTAVAGPDVVITETPGSPTDGVVVKIRRTLAVGSKLFARLNVVVTTP